jgi:hypothetical protein
MGYVLESRHAVALACIAAGLLALLWASAAWAHHPDGDGSAETHPDPMTLFTGEGQLRTRAVAGSVSPSAREAARSLAETCTTTSRSSDNTSQAYFSGSSRVVKVIYAYPTDVGDRLSTYAPVIQSGVRYLAELVAGESGNTKSLRFDLGTPAGAGCVDIQTVPLLLPSTAYTAIPSQTFSLIRTELLARVVGQTGSRNFLVYADGINVPGVGGEAQVRSDDSVAGAQHALGNLWGVLYGRGGTDFFGSGAQYAPGTTSRTHVDLVTHEISHTLGAVQRSAPHHSASFHCLDEWDILCYDDDGNGGLATYVGCGVSASQSWDCNKDDYFNPSPAPGSYLATHWNVYNSVFMCPAAQCAPGGVKGPPTFPGPLASEPPTTRITKKPGKSTRDRTPTFHFTSSDPGATFFCSQDTRAYRPCGSPLTMRKLAPGRHSFSVYAVDTARNRDPSAATASFRVKKPRR